MNTLLKIAIIVIVSAITFSCSTSRNTENNEYISNLIIPNQRESITFILGDDLINGNMFYSEAALYYSYNPESRTEYLVTTCRSLTEVHEYLSENPPSNKLPWGVVNLVTHGNGWLGLSVKIAPNQKRTTVTSLSKALESNMFNPLPVEIVDKETEFFVHGCSAGKNKELMQMIGIAFRSHFEVPLVRASLLFENYFSEQNSIMYDSKLYLAKAWFAYYKRGYKPGDIRLARQLKKRYPEADVNWRDILSRSTPRFPGDSYYYTFHVPVKWIVTYPDEKNRPDISSEEAKTNWLLDQDLLLETIDAMNISFNKFSWRIKNIKYRLDDGTLIPAIRAKGYSTVLCIIIPELKKENGIITNQPAVPDLFDTTYYFVSRGYELPEMKSTLSDLQTGLIE